MIFAGIRTFSFVDYPGRVSVVIYTVGCNFRCPWCHNWKIAYGNQYEKVSENEILDRLKFLRKRIKAACVTGGEPTIQKGLLEFAKKVKDIGYLVKLDTNGANPDIVGNLISYGVIDYVAVDIKSKPNNYWKLTNNWNSNLWEKVSDTMTILRNSNIDYEFRMTYVPGLSSYDDIEFFESILQEGEKGYIGIANSTEIFRVKTERNGIKLKNEKLLIR